MKPKYERTCLCLTVVAAPLLLAALEELAALIMVLAEEAMVEVANALET